MFLTPGPDKWIPEPKTAECQFPLDPSDEDYTLRFQPQTTDEDCMYTTISDEDYTAEFRAQATKNLWLFDILADPLEKNDLSDSQPEVVKMLLDRLQYYNSTAVPCLWPSNSADADPKKHGGFWGPWED